MAIDHGLNHLINCTQTMQSTLSPDMYFIQTTRFLRRERLYSAIKIQYLYRSAGISYQSSCAFSVSLRAWADQVSKAGRPACASVAFTVSDHLKCGLSNGLLLFAILENITVFRRYASSMASSLVAHAMVRLFRRTRNDVMPKLL